LPVLMARQVQEHSRGEVRPVSPGAEQLPVWQARLVLRASEPFWGRRRKCSPGPGASVGAGRIKFAPVSEPANLEGGAVWAAAEQRQAGLEQTPLPAESEEPERPARPWPRDQDSLEHWGLRGDAPAAQQGADAAEPRADALPQALLLQRVVRLLSAARARVQPSLAIRQERPRWAELLPRVVLLPLRQSQIPRR
jgi:hypothetical protein